MSPELTSRICQLLPGSHPFARRWRRRAGGMRRCAVTVASSHSRDRRLKAAASAAATSFRQGCHADQRHVAVEQPSTYGVGESQPQIRASCDGLHDGVAGAPTDSLCSITLDVFVGAAPPVPSTPPCIDHVDVGRAEIACGADHVLQHAAPCQWLAALSAGRNSPLALTAQRV